MLTNALGTYLVTSVFVMIFWAVCQDPRRYPGRELLTVYFLWPLILVGELWQGFWKYVAPLYGYPVVFIHALILRDFQDIVRGNL